MAATATSTRIAGGDIGRLGELRHSGAAGKHGYVVLLGLRSFDTLSVVRSIERGLSFAAFERLQKNIELSTQELAEVVRISLRTLSRRKDKGRLQPDESDRLVRVARIFAQAIELFEGDAAGARAWLTRAQRGLGGVTPLDMLKTDVGTREVEVLIGRLEHGIVT